MSKPRMLLILAPSAEEIGRDRGRMLTLAESVRRENRAFNVGVEFFDPVHESPHRYRYFSNRLTQVRRGYFDVVLIGGALLPKHLIELLQEIPDTLKVENYATPESQLDEYLQNAFHLPNLVQGAAQGKP